MSMFVVMNAKLAQIRQLALNTLEPVAAFASGRLALRNPHEINVMSVRLAHASNDALIVQSGHNIRVGLGAQRLALHRLHVVRVKKALVSHCDLKLFSSIQQIPRIGQILTKLNQ